MDLKRQKQLRDDFLVTLWEMHDGNYGGDQSTKELCRRIRVDYDTEGSAIGQHLRGEGLVIWSGFEWISLTVEGRRKAEQIVEQRLEERETRVLRTIFTMGHGRESRLVPLNSLRTELGMPYGELESLCAELEERGHIESENEYVKIRAAGVRALSSGEKQSQPGGITYNTNFNDAVYGAQIGGSQNTQSIQFNNQPITEILPNLAELISAVKEQDFAGKDEVVADLEKVHALASGDVNEGVWKRVQTRLTAAKTTMEIAGLAYKSLAYWPLIWDYFNRHA